MLRKVSALVVVGMFSLVLAGCGGGDAKTKTGATTKTGEKSKTESAAPAATAPKMDSELKSAQPINT